MDKIQTQLIDNIRKAGYNTMANHAMEQFEKGYTYSEVWNAITDVNEIFKDTLWENKEKKNED